jgi:hypothetical protein
MATTHWTGNAGDKNFNTPGNWDNGVPTSTVDAIITGTSGFPLTVSYLSGTDTARTLTTTFTTLAMGGGSLTIALASNLDSLNQTSGTLDFQNGGSASAVSTFSGVVTKTGGTLVIAAGTLQLSGSNHLAGLVSGAGSLTTQSGTTAVDNLQIGNGATLDDKGTETLTTGNLFLGSNAPGTATLTVEAGSVFDILGNVGIANGGGANAIGNAGTFEKTSGLGTSVIAPGFTNTGTVTVNSGTLEFTASVDDIGTMDADGAVLDLVGPVTGTGTLRIDHAGSLEFGGTVASGLSVVFGTGIGNTLSLGAPLSTQASITGFGQGDTTVFASIGYSATDRISSYAGGVLTITDASGNTTLAKLTINAPSFGSFGLENVGGRLALDVTCFVAGTRILTTRGDVPVQDLREGDLVVTHLGRPAPVVWIGRRRIDCRRHPNPELVRPIRVAAGAFGDRQPKRDLWLSPDHAVFTEERLIPARLLVNGMTIVQDDSFRSVEYFHVELDAHSILIAEGLPSESYLDTGNRGLFDNGGSVTVLHPDFAVDAEARSRAEGACAPLAVAPALVEPVWRSLAARAEARGHGRPATATTTDADLRLVVAGRDIRPVDVTGGRHVFVLPIGSETIRLVSRAASPAAVQPWHDDRRRLGVAVSRLACQAGAGREDLPLDGPMLSEGWWGAEQDGPARWRWTDGDASLRLPPDCRIVEVHLLRDAMRYPLEADQEVRVRRRA